MADISILYRAWGRLILAYLLSFVLSFGAGVGIITFLGVPPETLFEMSTKRLSYAFTVFESGADLGIDRGLMLFFWNCAGALFTMSLLYTATLFDRRNIELPPKLVRKGFCGTRRMKLLCFLPGCLSFEEESVRRAYVWLMIPWLGLILLGVESGLAVSTSAQIFGSYFLGVISLVPHGLIEIPAVAFAGAVSFAAHLLIKRGRVGKTEREVFDGVAAYRNELPVKRYMVLVVGALFIAGLIEAHVTQRVVENLTGFTGG